MKKQTITWTAIPNGSDGPLAEGTTLRLSAFVSPRLWNDDAGVAKMKLSDFPDFLDWPAVTLRPAAAGGDDQGLTERVRVPRRPRAGLKRHARPADAGRLGTIEQRVNPNRSGKPVFRPLPRSLDRKSVV